MNRELRILVAGVASERLGVNELTVSVVENGLTREHAGTCELRLEPKLAEVLRRVRQYVDADAKGLHVRRGFVDARRYAGTMKQQAKREPADAAADDENLEHPRPRSLRLRLV